MLADKIHLQINHALRFATQLSENSSQVESLEKESLHTMYYIPW